MATVEKTPAIDPEVLTDLEAVCNTKGIVRDPKLLRRITERADRFSKPTLYAYYPGNKEGHRLTRRASKGSGGFSSLARRVAMRQHAELPCRGNIAASWQG